MEKRFIPETFEAVTIYATPLIPREGAGSLGRDNFLLADYSYFQLLPGFARTLVEVVEYFPSVDRQRFLV